MSHAASVEIIREGRGSHFDPEVLDAFLDLAGEFHDIAQRFSDSTIEGE
jgi:putative two-component system response regulator